MVALWYVLKSKPNKEDALYAQLATRGLEAYYPYLDVAPVNPRARQRLPFFPGYMFIHVDLSRVGLSAINWMPYASGLVSFDGEPASIKEDLLWSLHRNIEEYRRRQAGASGQFRPGERLTVTSGAFAGYEAIFDTRLSSSNRIRIFLQLARGKQMPLELPALHVQRHTQESTFPHNRAE